MVDLLGNRLGEVDVWVRDAVRAIEADSPEAHVRIIRGSALVMRAGVFYLRGDLQHAMPLCREAVEMMPERDDPALPGLLVSVNRRSEEHTSELQSRQYLVC